VPFRAGNQFLGEGGLQDVFYNIRDKTRTIADAHANLGRTIDSSIVQHLQKLRSEIKGHIRNVERDTGRLATTVARERESSTKQIAELARAIALFKNTPMAVTAKDDPYVQNVLVAKQLQKQVVEENALQKSIVIMQQSSAHFEEGIVRSIQSTWQTFDEWQSRMSATVQETWRALGESMASLSPDREWVEFAARTDHLLDPETPLRNPGSIEYPFKNDPSVVAVHTGMLERKKKWSRTWGEGYFVLTPAGWLHEYPNSDPTARASPRFSLFLPICTLGPPSTQRSRSHKFQLEGKGEAELGGSSSRRSSILSVGGKIGSVMSGGSHSYGFRARSHEEMMEWWHDCRMLVARYLVASEAMDRSGPVEAAVRAAGYTSDDIRGEGESEDEEADGDAGSSEGEEHRGRERQSNGGAAAASAGGAGGASSTFVGKRYSLHDDAVPAYNQGEYQYQPTGVQRSALVEAGANGYAVSVLSFSLLSPIVGTYSFLFGAMDQPEKKRYSIPGGYGEEDAAGGGGIGQDDDRHHTNGNVDVTRRPSKRQLEKAPEGRRSRILSNVHDDDSADSAGDEPARNTAATVGSSSFASRRNGGGGGRGRSPPGPDRDVVSTDVANGNAKSAEGFWSSGQTLRDGTREDRVREEEDLPEYLCGGAQSQAPPKKGAGRKRVARRQGQPSSSSGRQRKAKAGSRVKSRNSFRGNGKALNEDEDEETRKQLGTGFRKQAASKRARDIRVAAIEARLNKMQGEPIQVPDDDPNDNQNESTDEEEDDDEEYDVIAETDADRRRILSSSMKDDESESVSLRNQKKLTDFWSSGKRSYSSSSPSGMGSGCMIIDLSSDEEAESKTREDTQDLLRRLGLDIGEEADDPNDLGSSKEGTQAREAPEKVSRVKVDADTQREETNLVENTGGNGSDDEEGGKSKAEWTCRACTL
ncbi:hypothetical protein FRC17_009876, partial [Serendipita sp. 399]